MLCVAVVSRLSVCGRNTTPLLSNSEVVASRFLSDRPRRFADTPIAKRRHPTAHDLQTNLVSDGLLLDYISGRRQCGSISCCEFARSVRFDTHAYLRELDVVKRIVMAAVALLASSAGATNFQGIKFSGHGTVTFNFVQSVSGDPVPSPESFGVPPVGSGLYVTGTINFGRYISDIGTFIINEFDFPSYTADIQIHSPGYSADSDGGYGDLIFTEYSQLYYNSLEITDGHISDLYFSHGSDSCGTTSVISIGDIGSSQCQVFDPQFGYVATWSIDAYAQQGVPEPSSWLLMIGGFALVGSALRRSYMVQSVR